MTQAPVTDKAAPKTEDEKKDYQMFAISVPTDLASTIETEAKKLNVSPSVLLRRNVAVSFKYDITAFERSRRKGRVKYSSEEEKATAIKQKAATVRALVERYNKGLITIEQDEIDAAMAAIKPRAKKAEKAAS